MKKIYINNYFKFYLALYLTLIIGFILNENSTGGAIIDYLNQKRAVKDFSNDFLTTLLNYDKYSTRHSPIFIIILPMKAFDSKSLAPFKASSKLIS